MSHLHTKSGFRLSTLALSLGLATAAIVFSAPTYALEAVSDSELSNATGEGLAYFSTNFQLEMPSVFGDSTSALGTAGTFGAGTGACSGANPGGCGSFVYLSPIGPVAAATGNKTDLYIYGLSISSNDNHTTNTTAASGLAAGSVVSVSGNTAAGFAQPHNTIFNSATGVNWGTQTDPFLLKVNTTASLPSLDGGNVAVPYLQIAAPTIVTNNNTLDSYSANNIRLGLWANVMQYNVATVNTSNTAVSGPAGPALQLLGIWDGFGINGTVVNMFPTATCATAAKCPYGTTGSTVAVPGHGEYQATLGLAGVLRFNSQPEGVLRFAVNQPTSMGVFDPYEGIYLQNVDSNLPLGNINYQPLMLNSGVSGGKATISLELAQIANAPAVYQQFYVNYDCTNQVGGCATNTGYSYYASGTTTAPSAGTTAVDIRTDGANTFVNYVGAAGSDNTGSAIVGRNSVTGISPQAGLCNSGSCPSTATHGSITIGDVYTNNTGAPVTLQYKLTLNDGTTAAGTTVTVNDVTPPGGSNALFNSAGVQVGNGTGGTAIVNGVTFSGRTGNQSPVNLGTASISGLVINHMKMTLTGL